MLQKICILNECCSFDLSIHPEKPEESVTVSTNILNSTTALNFDNKRCFLSSKSAFLELFMKNNLTLKTAVMMTKIKLFHHMNKLSNLN